MNTNSYNHYYKAAPSTSVLCLRPLQYIRATANFLVATACQTFPDPWEDLASRAPNVVPHTRMRYFPGTLKGDLLSRSSQAFGLLIFQSSTRSPW